MMRWWLIVAMLLSVARPASAHRLDEYLQATQFTIERDRVEALVRLTPGVHVALAIFDQVDADVDGVISGKEARTYGQRMLRDLSLSIDGTAVTLELASVDFPTLRSMVEGVGEIRLRFGAKLPGSASKHTLVFENHHQERMSVYLVNSLVPADPGIRIEAQQRNATQSIYRLDWSAE